MPGRARRWSQLFIDNLQKMAAVEREEAEPTTQHRK